MRHLAYPRGITRRDLIEWFRQGRDRSREIFAIPKAEMFYERPIKLRNPIVFYEGHLPAFAVNTFLKLALKQPGVDADYEVLFERGIDPESEDSAKPTSDLWPPRRDVQAYGAEAERRIERALCNAEIERDDVPQLRSGEAAIAILEHEQMHQETLLYMLHEMPYEQKNERPPLHAPRVAGGGRRVGEESVKISAGIATLGAGDHFAWDNELPQHKVEVEAFKIDAYKVTNGQYADYIRATGAEPPHFWKRIDGQWYWRGMFELTPLPLDAPVYISQDEATAYARWLGKRVPTEPEWHRAAFGTPSGEERLYPWGDDPPNETRGNFGFANWDPVPVGSYPAGASGWGVHDLIGNGWEWTSTPFAGFDGFQPMASYPNYSADFFDGQHFVLKGASPATALQLVRRSFRNWFRGNYPYVYATFRCAV